MGKAGYSVVSYEKWRMRTMKQLLVVVDMQVDFVTGALGTTEAKAIVENVVKKVKEAKAMGKDGGVHP